MKKSKILLSFFLPALLFGCNELKDNPGKSVTEDIFSNPPTDSSQLFAPGIVSRGIYERDVAITSDGKELFFGVLTGKNTTIMHMKKTGEKWTEPEIAPFARDSRFFFLEPAFSPDDQQLFFLSTLPRENEDTLAGWANQNIWYVQRGEDGEWGDPESLGDVINTGGGEFFPSVANNGNLYFTWNAEGSRKNYIKKSEWINNEYSEPEVLPENVCGDGQIFNACIAPDESYLIGCAAGREEGLGNEAYYYVFFNLGDGNWSDGIRLNESVNMPGSQAISPYITRDGKYLFFASSFSPKPSGKDHTLSAEDIYSHYNHPQNGLSDIYWISTDFIKSLKP